MFQDIVRAIFLIGFHKGLYMLTYFFLLVALEIERL